MHRGAEEKCLLEFWGEFDCGVEIVGCTLCGEEAGGWEVEKDLFEEFGGCEDGVGWHPKQ